VRASERYLVLEYGFNLNQGCSEVGTAFPHLFFLAPHPWVKRFVNIHSQPENDKQNVDVAPPLEKYLRTSMTTTYAQFHLAQCQNFIRPEQQLHSDLYIYYCC